MATRPTLGLGMACGCALILLASCRSIDVYGFHHRHYDRGRGNGPPAHTKAHGYRRKQVHGYDLEYSTIYDMYIVVGVSDCYYRDGHFYRFHAGSWQISLRPDCNWGPVAHESLPPGLRVKAKAKGKGKNIAKIKF